MRQWQSDRKSCPLVLAFAERRYAAVVSNDRGLGNRQAKTQTAKFACDQWVALSKGFEDFRQGLGIDASSRIGDLDHQPIRRVVSCAHPDFATCRGEFGGVLQ